MRPDRMLAVILAGPRDQVGAAIVRYLLEQLDDPKAQARFVVILRTALGSGPGSRMLKEFLVREVLARLATAGGADDAELRATLAASQLVGLMITRYVVKLEPIAHADPGELVDRIGPVIQWHLFGTAMP